MLTLSKQNLSTELRVLSYIIINSEDWRDLNSKIDLVDMIKNHQTVIFDVLTSVKLQRVGREIEEACSDLSETEFHEGSAEAIDDYRNKIVELTMPYMPIILHCLEGK